MKIAIPLHEQLTLYHNNPCTAPKFAIYLIEGDTSHIVFSLEVIVDNPWSGVKCDRYEDEQISCNCDPDRRKSMRHISEHYALLDAIGGCSYLLADRYCDNTTRALGNGGITIFKIPPIINKIDNAIKNFLIGASFASTVEHIHHAS
jgi:predicted Fe-Mo cluster-binding NifX family protein